MTTDNQSIGPELTEAIEQHAVKRKRACPHCKRDITATNQRCYAGNCYPKCCIEHCNHAKPKALTDPRGAIRRVIDAAREKAGLTKLGEATDAKPAKKAKEAKRAEQTDNG